MVLSRHWTFRVEEDIAESINAMAEDIKKDKSYLINFALRMLCEAGGPDGLFQQKVRAIMMESLGFDNVEGLLDIMDARFAALTSMEILRPDPDKISRDVPQVEDPVRLALEFILEKLECDIEPTLDEVSTHVGMDKDTLSMVLSTRGIKTSRVRRGGKRQQYYLKDKLPSVRGALGLK